MIRSSFFSLHQHEKNANSHDSSRASHSVKKLTGYSTWTSFSMDSSQVFHRLVSSYFSGSLVREAQQCFSLSLYHGLIHTQVNIQFRSFFIVSISSTRVLPPGREAKISVDSVLPQEIMPCYNLCGSLRRRILEFGSSDSDVQNDFSHDYQFSHGSLFFLDRTISYSSQHYQPTR